MNVIDFFFSYNQSIRIDFYNKRYFKGFRKLFNYPYKFILDKFRELFSLKKFNLDKHEQHFKDMGLDELFEKYNSDKASKFVINNEKINGHNYSPFYEKYFKKYKELNNLRILEIGSLKGAATASFYKYFNRPKIICADINPFQLQVFSKNIRAIYLNTQSKDSIKNLSSFLDKDFDIIIDDGSHNIKDQIITFNTFFRKLKKNGIYVIEDSSQYLSASHLNPDNLDYGSKEILLSIKNSGLDKVSYLSNLEIDILKKEMGNINLEKGNYIENKINISEIIFIEKK